MKLALAAAVVAFAASTAFAQDQNAETIDFLLSDAPATVSTESPWPKAIGPLINWMIGDEVIAKLVLQCPGPNEAEGIVQRQIKEGGFVDFVIDEFREEARNHLTDPTVLWDYWEQHRESVLSEMALLENYRYASCVQHLATLADSLTLGMKPEITLPYSELLLAADRSTRLYGRYRSEIDKVGEAGAAIYVDEVARSEAISAAARATYPSDDKRNEALQVARDGKYVDEMARDRAIKAAEKERDLAKSRWEQASDDVRAVTSRWERTVAHLGWNADPYYVRFGLRRKEEGGLPLVETYLKIVLDLREQLGATNRIGLIDAETE